MNPSPACRRKPSRGPASLFTAALLLALSASALSQTIGPVGGSDTTTLTTPISYGKPHQSRIWFNSHAGRWDAVIPRADSSNPGTDSDHYVVKDVAGAQIFTSTELDDRNLARPDVFWDDAGRTLYVLASHPRRSEFWRLAYDDATDSYLFEVGAKGAGLPVPGIMHPDVGEPGGSFGGNSAASLGVSPNGQVWVSVMRQGGLYVQRSTTGGATWPSTPVKLDSGAKVGVTAWVDFEYLGTTYMGVFASENGEVLAVTDFAFWYVNQASDVSLVSNWIDDSANIPNPLGIEQSDDHVSVAKDASGNAYFAVKTESGNPADPLIKLFARTPGGVWSTFKVTETRDTPEQSRPSVVIDDDNRELYIYTNDIGGKRTVRRVKASLDTLETLASAPVVTVFDKPGAVFSDVISPRQAVNARTGTVVLTHNRSARTVWFAAHTIDEPAAIGPDVSRLTQTEAERALTDVDLAAGTVRLDNGTDTPAGSAISQ